MIKPTFILVMPGFPKDETDTSCVPSFQQFALSFKKQYPQYRLVVVTFQYPFFEKEYIWNGIEIMALGGKNKAKLSRIITWIKAYRKFRKIKGQSQVVGLISAWVGECALVAKVFAYRHQLKYIAWIAGQDAKKSNRYVSRIRPQPYELIAMSDFLQDEFYKNHHIKPVNVIKNGISTGLFPELNVNQRTIDILGVGSLIPLKNYALFIELILGIKQLIPSVKAVIAGGGAEEENLQNLIRSYDLQDTLHLIGPKTHSEVLDLMNQSKVFLHTSDYEGNATVLIEALYSGCRIFSTRPLADEPVEGLWVSTDQKLLKENIVACLREKPLEPKRVLFNDMNSSVKEIVELFKVTDE